MENNELIKIAYDCALKAYAPYSNYCVGAAILSKNNNVYTGCNVENASYSATICAERNAIFSAINNGEMDFDKIAIVALKNATIDQSVVPCGVCAQVMSEFCDKDFIIITALSLDSYKEYRLHEILPNAFTKGNL